MRTSLSPSRISRSTRLARRRDSFYVGDDDDDEKGEMNIGAAVLRDNHINASANFISHTVNRHSNDGVHVPLIFENHFSDSPSSSGVTHGSILELQTTALYRSLSLTIPAAVLIYEQVVHPLTKSDETLSHRHRTLSALSEHTLEEESNADDAEDDPVHTRVIKYRVEVTSPSLAKNSCRTWSVVRRYQEFLDLYRKVIATGPQQTVALGRTPKEDEANKKTLSKLFPAMRSFSFARTNSSRLAVEQRRVKLEAFLKFLVSKIVGDMYNVVETFLQPSEHRTSTTERHHHQQHQNKNHCPQSIANVSTSTTALHSTLLRIHSVLKYASSRTSTCAFPLEVHIEPYLSLLLWSLATPFSPYVVQIKHIKGEADNALADRFHTFINFLRWLERLGDTIPDGYEVHLFDVAERCEFHDRGHYVPCHLCSHPMCVVETVAANSTARRCPNPLHTFFPFVVDGMGAASPQQGLSSRRSRGGGQTVFSSPTKQIRGDTGYASSRVRNSRHTVSLCDSDDENENENKITQKQEKHQFVRTTQCQCSDAFLCSLPGQTHRYEFSIPHDYFPARTCSFDENITFPRSSTCQRRDDDFVGGTTTGKQPETKYFCLQVEKA
eukprot:PhM_4_TR18038/c0_g1_i1/m.37343